MQSSLITIAIATGIVLLSGPLLIPFLRHLKFGQYIRIDGPQSHLQKAGTPTMGGLIFFVSLTGTLWLVGVSQQMMMALLVTLGFGLIGFFDDFIKVVLKRALGLRAREKLGGQILLAAVFSYVAVVYAGRGTALYIPSTEFSFDLGLLYYPVAVFIIVATVNAVNLTDGLDGLAAGGVLFSAVTYILLTQAWGLNDLGLFASALLGSCLGFLFFNIHPARVFMGDTGSFVLGGALAALAVLTRTELLLPIIGGVFVLETLSVIIQVTFFKVSGGRRLLRMSPLHHHFELCGWSEQKVVLLFWTVAALFASLAVLLAL